MKSNHPTLSNVVHTETEAQAIVKRNANLRTREDRRKRKIRRELEARQEAKELGIDYKDLL